MARPMRVTIAAQAASTPLILNQMGTSPFNVGLGVTLSAGASLTYNVEYTFDDVFAPNYNPATGNWIVLTALSAQTASKDSNMLSPVMAVRLNVTTYASGTATLTVIQANQ